MFKVSLIIAVFNAELHVARALNSAMKQTLDEVEYIIIDDGSTDNSLSVINEVITHYPNRRSHVTIISRENLGIAVTRAEGVSIAKGNYIIHLDSDDWVEPNWLELMYQKAIFDGSDIVVCDYTIISRNNNLKVNQKKCDTPQNCIRALLRNEISNANWNKLIKKELIIKHKISYISGLNMGEDFYFSFMAFWFSKKISFVSKNIYNYNITNENSLTNNYNDKLLSDLVKTVSLVEEFLLENDKLDYYKNDMNHFKLNVRSCFVSGTNGQTKYFKMAIKLYPETNYLLFITSKYWTLKVIFLLSMLRCHFLFDLLFKIKKLLK